MTSLIVPSGYGVVVFESLLMGAQLVLIGFSVGSVRSKFFTKEFFTKNFPKDEYLHNSGGYPDMGSGLLSSKLTNTQWLEFNNAQRAHYNYLEGIVPAMTSLLVSGLFYPKLAAISGAGYIWGRALYTGGYKNKGPKGRTAGAIIFDISLVTMTVAALVGCWGWFGGVDGIKNLLLN